MRTPQMISYAVNRFSYHHVSIGPQSAIFLKFNCELIIIDRRHPVVKCSGKKFKVIKTDETNPKRSISSGYGGVALIWLRNGQRANCLKTSEWILYFFVWPKKKLNSFSRDFSKRNRKRVDRFQYAFFALTLFAMSNQIEAKKLISSFFINFWRKYCECQCMRCVLCVWFCLSNRHERIFVRLTCRSTRPSPFFTNNYGVCDETKNKLIVNPVQDYIRRDKSTRCECGRKIVLRSSTIRISFIRVPMHKKLRKRNRKLYKIVVEYTFHQPIRFIHGWKKKGRKIQSIAYANSQVSTKILIAHSEFTDFENNDRV